jgi:hypothetical protein
MPASELTPEALIALFEAKATTPPKGAEQLLVRHLKCKKSIELARCLSEAIGRYSGTNNQPLPAPTELLPPLG